MPIRSRKLLVLAALCWVAPASAMQVPGPATGDHAGCPHEARRIVVIRPAHSAPTELSTGYRPSAIFP